MTSAVRGYSSERLIAFEKRVEQAFLNRQIYAPIHLSSGNEEQVLEVFHRIADDDWVFSTWRSHYHALLKGIPEDELFQAILDGRSMYIQSKPHRFFASSICGGILSIALGAALGIKRLGGLEQVWVFVGDMAATMGVFYETTIYASGHGLPLRVIVENNGLSTNTPTVEVWGGEGFEEKGRKVSRYKYTRGYPHTGASSWVTFG